MRHMTSVVAVFVLLSLASTCLGHDAIRGEREQSANKETGRVAIYDPDPDHLWNRIHRNLFVRVDTDQRILKSIKASSQSRMFKGLDSLPSVFGIDEVDPLIWPPSKFLLLGDSHSQVLSVLDEFLDQNGQDLINDPTRRVMLQHDMWTVFDWTDHPYVRARHLPDARAGVLQAGRVALRSRLAKILMRLALSEDEIRKLPNNYVAAVASDAFPRGFDEERLDKAYLPTDLLKPDGSWICLTGGRRNEVAAFAHVRFFAGRSTFLMFLRLPDGREKTREYLRNLNLFPKPWVVRDNSVIRARSGPASGQLRRNDVLQFNPKLPQFPVGTEVAFVRQMMAIGNDGNIIATPLTQSVQLRYYRRVGELPFSELRTTQVFHEWKLSRKRLFAGKTGGLHIEDDRQPALRSLQFVTGFSDPFESDELARHLTPKGNLCNACHSGGTVRSINTFARAAQRSRLKGPVLADTTPETERHRTIDWKQTQHEWGLFQGLLEKGASTN